MLAAAILLMSLRALPTDIDATVDVRAMSPAPAIWVASWKPVAEDLKYVTPMVWLDGDFRPGQDNVSIDPESLAAATKRLPAGRRVIIWYRYFRSFWGIAGDAVHCSDGTVFAGLWPVVSMPHIKAEWTRFLDLFKYCGGSIDFVVGDCEDWTRFTNWGINEVQLMCIRDDPRFKQPMFGIDSLSALTSGFEVKDAIRPQNSAAYLQWNLQIGRFAAAVMNETIWNPAIARFPGIQGCNYDGKQMLDRPAPELNGHPQPSDNIVGNCASPVAYGVIAQAATSWFLDDLDPTRLVKTGSVRLDQGPWQSFLIDVQLGRACRRQAPDRSLMPWIAPVTYPGDVVGTVGYPKDPRCWDEMIRHYALLGTSVFLWWNPTSVPVPVGSPILIKDLGAQGERLDRVLEDINRNTGGRVARTAACPPISFSASVVVTGALGNDGKFVWRVSAPPGTTALRDQATDRIYPLQSGELGVWLHTSTSTPPDLVLATH